MDIELSKNIPFFLFYNAIISFRYLNKCLSKKQSVWVKIRIKANSLICHIESALQNNFILLMHMRMFVKVTNLKHSLFLFIRIVYALS